MKIQVLVDYAQARSKKYPPIEDQLDAIWKGGAKLEAMRKKILDIKSTYPKP